MEPYFLKLGKQSLDMHLYLLENRGGQQMNSDGITTPLSHVGIRATEPLTSLLTSSTTEGHRENTGTALVLLAH